MQRGGQWAVTGLCTEGRGLFQETFPSSVLQADQMLEMSFGRARVEGTVHTNVCMSEKACSLLRLMWLEP